jgi:single-strand DNA-binding protein
MATLNKVMLIGNLTRDPEVRYTPKGSAVADVCIAVNRVWTTEAGQKQEEVTYVDIVLWANLAELASKYLAKGRPVYIEGRLQLDTWDDKATGQKRSRLRVVGENLQFLGPKPEGQSREDQEQEAGRAATQHQRPYSQRHNSPPADPAPDGPVSDGLGDDDIPF